MRRTLQDIRTNIDHVGCDNATAHEMCDRIETLTFHLLSLLAMSSACTSDMEVTENNRRRELARAALKD